MHRPNPATQDRMHVKLPMAALITKIPNVPKTLRAFHTPVPRTKRHLMGIHPTVMHALQTTKLLYPRS